MIIYTCESGKYSDYPVDALFSNEADAHLYAEVHGCEVVERVLDPDITEYRAGLKPYWVIMDRNGHARVVDIIKPNEYGSPHMDEANHYKLNELTNKDRRDEWEFYMFAKDEMHAVKIANERRTQLIANGGWYP